MATVSAQQFFGGQVPTTRAKVLGNEGEIQKDEATTGPTFLGGIIRGLVKPVAKVATSAVNLGQDIVSQPETQPFSGDYLGKVEKVGAGFDPTKGTTPENLNAIGDAVQTGAEIGSMLPAGGIAEKGASEVLNGVRESVSPSTGILKENIGNAIEKTGQKIQNVVIKPSVKDIKDGFKIENISKYDVGGSLPETIAKTHVKMNELSQKLTNKLKGSNATIDLNNTYEQTAKKLLNNKSKSFGDNSAIQRVLENLKSEITNATEGKTNVDLVTATNIKRGAGSKGSWAYNRPEADASAIEKVYTEFYNSIKSDIEKNAPEGVKEINKQISDLIPINNAALKRMTVEERNNALSLMDNIGLMSTIFDPKSLLLVGTNRALKSGKVGQALVNIGQKIKK